MFFFRIAAARTTLQNELEYIQREQNTHYALQVICIIFYKYTKNYPRCYQYEIDLYKMLSTFIEI